MTTENKELRKAGLKVTLPRVKILQILENSANKHLSAEDVYKALIEAEEEVGLATVYRVLTQFESAGLVMRHHFEGGHSIFELTSVDHHDHIVCRRRLRPNTGLKLQITVCTCMVFARIAKVRLTEIGFKPGGK